MGMSAKILLARLVRASHGRDISFSQFFVPLLLMYERCRAFPSKPHRMYSFDPSPSFFLSFFLSPPRHYLGLTQKTASVEGPERCIIAVQARRMYITIAATTHSSQLHDLPLKRLRSSDSSDLTNVEQTVGLDSNSMARFIHPPPATNLKKPEE
jgi:hypothetical protein